MKRKLPISVRRGLRALGESLKNARLTRNLKMVTVAERAGVSRETLSKIQAGDPGVSMGNYAAVIFALGLGTDWMKFADMANDPAGRALYEERLPKRVRDIKA